MKLGILLHQLWRRRLIVVVSFSIAVFASVLSAYKVSLLGLHPRAIGMATASTQVLVDNPYTIVLDINQGGYQLQQMAQSAALLGNVIASQTVRADIARIVGIPVQSIQATDPATTQFPQATTSPQNRKTTDLLASNNQYRINIQANPAVPILDIYSEAHSPAMAKALANAAVVGLRDYLATVAQGVPPKQQVSIEQLGQAQGGAVTGGLRVEVLGLVFLFAFALSCGALLVLDRVVKGWKLYRDSDGLVARPATARGGPDVA